MKIHREFESPPLRKNEMFMKIKNLTFLLLILTSFLLSQNKIAVVHFVEGDPIIKIVKEKIISPKRLIDLPKRL